MSRKLDDLSDRFRPKAFELLARLTEAGIPVMIIDTLRTEAEHQANLASGASKAVLSKHLPLRLREPLVEGDENAEKSDAIDICPYSVYELSGPDKLQWDSSDLVWRRIGMIGESIGLRWGGRWKSPHDPGHFEWVP